MPPYAVHGYVAVCEPGRAEPPLKLGLLKGQADCVTVSIWGKRLHIRKVVLYFERSGGHFHREECCIAKRGS